MGKSLDDGDLLANLVGGVLELHVCELLDVVGNGLVDEVGDLFTGGSLVAEDCLQRAVQSDPRLKRREHEPPLDASAEGMVAEKALPFAAEAFEEPTSIGRPAVG